MKQAKQLLGEVRGGQIIKLGFCCDYTLERERDRETESCLMSSYCKGL